MLNRNKHLYNLVVCALLCAVGIIIPTFSPIKILIEPASFTLASHVAVFIAMFISPLCAVAVSLGTTAGFFLGGFPLVVVMRALTHVIFALVGAMIIRRDRTLLKSPVRSTLFSFGIGVLHGVCEVAVTIPFFFAGMLPAANYDKGFMTSVILLVGVGAVIHSMVDYAISYFVWKPLEHQVAPLLSTAERRVAVSH